MQSRYYDPEIGRFLNADSYASTGRGVLGNNMFAYCNNKPVVLFDPTGNYGICNSNAMMRDGSRPFCTIPDDKYGKTTGMINGQAIFEHANESFGWGTYADNGCGVIALYNTMQLLGKPQALGKIEDEVALLDGMMLYGLLGVDPYVINLYFAEHNVESVMYSWYNAFARDVSEGSIVIVLLINDTNNIFNGLHYVTAQYSNGVYEIYNAYSNYPYTIKQESLFMIYEDSQFLCGYIIGG